MYPFDHYAQNGKALLGPPQPGDGTCRHGYGVPVFSQCGTVCAYCGRDLGSSYESWLDLSVDHVIPVSTRWSAEHRQWLGDICNMVTCCRACNEFLNGYRAKDREPTTEGEFYNLRDKIFGEKREHALKRHKGERAWYERWRAGQLLARGK